VATAPDFHPIKVGGATVGPGQPKQVVDDDPEPVALGTDPLERGPVLVGVACPTEGQVDLGRDDAQRGA
jgi:hypothetical protein